MGDSFSKEDYYYLRLHLDKDVHLEMVLFYWICTQCTYKYYTIYEQDLLSVLFETYC